MIRSAARRLKGRERRLFIAEVTIELCEGSERLSEAGSSSLGEPSRFPGVGEKRRQFARLEVGEAVEDVAEVWPDVEAVAAGAGDS